MKKVELLAPAGSMEALYAAVQNGCDAVYLGGEMFGARAYAHNFDEKAMLEAIRYAHGYGVKIYVTMNTLLFEEEMEDAVAYAKFLYEHHVDAIIVQDLGFFDVLHQMFPDLELHASTQMHIHNEQGIRLLQEAGMKRVVVPRETPLETIAKLAKLGVDLEVFVQGALCISYSGQCLMSSKKLQRSGNRGQCAQMCRMRYTLEEEKDGVRRCIGNQQYLLSPKDLNVLNHVEELIEAGISSFKIEGRMKRPAYVAKMVQLYRKAIDAAYAKQKFVEQDAQKEMEKLFHRGFTSGHLFHQRGRALMHTYRPNHMGIEIGKVIGMQQKKVKVRLCDALHQMDGLRFLDEKEDVGCIANRIYDQNGKLIKEAKANDIVYFDIGKSLAKGSKVLKTTDVLQQKELAESYQKISRRVKVSMHLTMKKQEMMHLQIQDEEGFVVEQTSETIVEQAATAPLQKERIIKQLGKCSDTIFEAKTIEVDMEDDVFVAIKEINALRREALIQLLKKRQERTYPCTYGSYQRCITASHDAPKTLLSVANEEQAKIAKSYGFTHIFLRQDRYQKMQDPSYGLHGERIIWDRYPKQETLLFCENSGMVEKHAFADHFVNITNSYAAAFLFAHGVEGIVLSSECSPSQQRAIQEAFKKRYQIEGNFYAMVYGRETLMVMEYCPINLLLKDGQRKNCQLCKQDTRYYLKDVGNHYFPLQGDTHCRMQVYDDEVLDQIEDASSINHYLCFLEEKAEKVKEVLEREIEHGKRTVAKTR